MVRIVVVAAAALAATAALAQPVLEAGLFISPAGEPFRSKPGEPYPLPVWFNGADADQSGSLSPAEFDADAQRFFGTLDLNKDNRIDGAETRAYERDVAPEIVRRVPLLSERSGAAGDPGDSGMSPMRTLREPPTGGQRLRPPNEGAGFYALLNEPQPVTASDGDFNSLITRQEFSAAAKRRFTRLDANADRMLKLDELPVPPVQAGTVPVRR